MSVRCPKLTRPRFAFGKAVAAATLLLAVDVNFTHAQDPSLNFVNETATEFSTSGDWDGNGLVDVMILDKASGFIRFGYQLSPLHLEWAEPEVVGLEQITGCAVGTFFELGRHGLAFTAPEANRIQIFQGLGRSQSTTVSPVFPSGLGPFGVLALPPASGSSRQDLLISTIWNGVQSNRFEVLANVTNDFKRKFSLAAGAPFQQANRVRFQVGGAEYGSMLSKGSGPITWWVCQAAGSLIEVASITNLPATTHYLFGQFDQSGFNHFLFYEPGQPILIARQSDTNLVKPGFSVAVEFRLQRPVAQWLAVPGTNETRLLALFADGDGTEAAVYTFDGRIAPQMIQTFQAGAASRFTGGTLLAGGHLVLFTGSFDGQSTGFQVQRRSGSGYQQADSGSLPTLDNRSSGANVLFFAADPFAARGTPLVGVQRRRDWTSQLHFTNTPASAGVQAESRGGATQGLHDPVNVDITPPPLGAQAGLANQVTTTISLFSFAPAAGDTVDSIQISPSPGSYSTPIRVALTAQHPDTVLYYRLNATAAWLAYGPAIQLGRTTTVQYFAQRPSGRRSAIASASYEFPQATDAMDSDGDGVPDFVELAYGLDPLASGWDADGDSASDFSELLHATNPDDPSSRPAAAADLQSSFDLVVTPRPWDGTAGTNTFALATSSIRGFDLQGAFLSVAPILKSQAKPFLPQAWLTNLPVRFDCRLLALATEPHFDLDTAGPDRRLGRELLGLFPPPTMSVPSIAYTGQGGEPAVEAGIWVTALRKAAGFKQRQVATTELTVGGTLTALLLEQKIGQILFLRRQVTAPRVSLFPFRLADARRPVDLAMLEDLEQQHTLAADQVEPGYKLLTMFETLRAQVEATNSPAMRDLRTVAETLYTLNSVSTNTATSVAPSPIEALRQFLDDRSLPEAYGKHPSLPKALLTRAGSAASAALAAVQPRPVREVVLRVTGQSTGCTTLEALDRSVFHLVDPFGQPYRLSEHFQLLPGSLLLVKGYADASASCVGPALEVIEATIEVVPAPLETDQDGNLLPDAWERFFLASTGQDPNADPDGDLYSNAQEYLEGSSPNDPQSRPSVPPTGLGRPSIRLEHVSDGRLHLSWDWPEAYASAVKFGIRTSRGLGEPFTEHPVAPVHAGPGRYEAWLPTGAPGIAFFQVYYSLAQ
jgi:hypothetical protein